MFDLVTNYIEASATPSGFAEIEEFFRDDRIHDDIKIKILSSRLFPIRFSEVEAFLRERKVDIRLQVAVATHTKGIGGPTEILSFVSDTEIPQEIRVTLLQGFFQSSSGMTLTEALPFFGAHDICEDVLHLCVYRASRHPWLVLQETIPALRDPSVAPEIKERIIQFIRIDVSKGFGEFMRDEEIPGHIKRRFIERLSGEVRASRGITEFIERLSGE